MALIAEALSRRGDSLAELLGYVSLTSMIRRTGVAPLRVRLSPHEQDLRNRAARAAAALTGERADLLAAVLAAPADDAPRLVYADWLDEHGEPVVAELIRVQCEIARRPGPATCTGVSASWCPNCGDCVCPADECGDYPRKDHPACPLHAPASFHDGDERTYELLGRTRLLIPRARARLGWGPFKLTSTVNFEYADVHRGFPRGLDFHTLKHALRWARAVGTWLPVRVVRTNSARPLPTADGGRWYFEEGPDAEIRHQVPTEVFRFLGPFRGTGGLEGSDLPTLRRTEVDPARRYAYYPTLEKGQGGIARALADYCRHLAGYTPINNPRPLPLNLFE